MKRVEETKRPHTQVQLLTQKKSINTDRQHDSATWHLCKFTMPSERLGCVGQGGFKWTNEQQRFHAIHSTSHNRHVYGHVMQVAYAM